MLRATPLTKAWHWYAGLPLTMVAKGSLLAGLVLRLNGGRRLNDWGRRARCLRRADHCVGDRGG